MGDLSEQARGDGSRLASRLADVPEWDSPSPTRANPEGLDGSIVLAARADVQERGTDAPRHTRGWHGIVAGRLVSVRRNQPAVLIAHELLNGSFAVLATILGDGQGATMNTRIVAAR